MRFTSFMSRTLKCLAENLISWSIDVFLDRWSFEALRELRANVINMTLQLRTAVQVTSVQLVLKDECFTGRRFQYGRIDCNYMKITA